LHAVWIQHRTESGEPLASYAELYASPILWGCDRCPDSATELTAFGDWPLAIAAGVPAETVPGRRDSRVLLYNCDAPTDALGPIDYVVEIPGYRRVRQELWARPLEDGLQPSYVDLEPLGGQMGTLEIAWESPPEFPEESAGVTVGYIALTEIDSSARLSFAVRAPLFGMIVEGIPAGIYRLEFVGKDWGLSLAEPGGPEILADLRNGHALCTVSCGTLGNLALTVYRADGEAVQGTVQFELASPGRVGGTFVTRVGPPYRFRLLPAGIHSIQAVWVNRLWVENPLEHQVVVIGGTEHAVQFTLP
jgi:hypothetical protein